MQTPSTGSVIKSLGERLRTARRARGLSQEALAAPEFSKSYVSALEHSKARPSLKALELLAGRLGVPMAEFLVAPPADTPAIDFAALDEDLTYQIDCARRAIDTGRAAEAVALLDEVEASYADYVAQIPVATRYRLHYARATANVRLQSPTRAQRDLEIAGELAEQISDGGEAVARVRNGLGGILYLQDLPHLALAQHLLCVHAIHTGVVQDLNLRLLIYSNLANDYLMLNEVEAAISTYKEALTLLDDVSNLERQAGIYWGLSLAYKAKGDLAWARIYAARALRIYEAAENGNALALMQANLAELHLARKEYAPAETLLEQARQYQERAGNTVFLSRVYEQLALLALDRDDLTQAAGYAEQSVQLIARARADATETPDVEAQTNAVRTQARALRVAGLVAERQRQPDQADVRFRQALDVSEEIGASETAYQIRLSYADLLVARGAHKEAAQYYRAAAQQHVRPGSR